MGEIAHLQMVTSDLADRAVLGACLHDPANLDRLGPLQPTHLRQDAHQALLQVMQTMPRPTRPTWFHSAPLEQRQNAVTDWVQQVWQAVRAVPDFRGRQFAYLVELMGDCPRPEHVGAYAQLSLQAAARRSLAESTAQLAQRLARAADAHGLHQASDEQLPRLAAALERVATAYQATLTSAEGSDGSLRAAAAGRWQQTQPALVPDQVVAREAQLTAALLRDPQLLDQVSRWLRPQDFTLSEYAASYTAMVDLRTRGHPVDAVTVAAQVEDAGRFERHVGFVPANLMHLARQPVADGVQLAHDIAHAATAASMRKAAGIYREMVFAHGTPVELLREGQAAIAAIRHAAARLGGAAPSSAQPAPAPRHRRHR